MKGRLLGHVLSLGNKKCTYQIPITTYRYRRNNRPIQIISKMAIKWPIPMIGASLLVIGHDLTVLSKLQFKVFSVLTLLVGHKEKQLACTKSSDELVQAWLSVSSDDTQMSCIWSS